MEGFLTREEIKKELQTSNDVWVPLVQPEVSKDEFTLCSSAVQYRKPVLRIILGSTDQVTLRLSLGSHYTARDTVFGPTSLTSRQLHFLIDFIRLDPSLVLIESYLIQQFGEGQVDDKSSVAGCLSFKEITALLKNCDCLDSACNNFKDGYVYYLSSNSGRVDRPLLSVTVHSNGLITLSLTRGPDGKSRATYGPDYVTKQQLDFLTSLMLLNPSADIITRFLNKNFTFA